MTYNHMTAHLTKSRLGELLKQSGLSREDLAKLTEASPRTIEAIESGKYDPPLSLAYKLAAAFRIPVEELFGGEHKTLR